MSKPKEKPVSHRRFDDPKGQVRTHQREGGEKNTPEGLNCDVSAGTSHSEPDGSATKPAISRSEDGASQGAAPKIATPKPAHKSAQVRNYADEVEHDARLHYGFPLGKLT